MKNKRDTAIQVIEILLAIGIAASLSIGLYFKYTNDKEAKGVQLLAEQYTAQVTLPPAPESKDIEPEEPPVYSIGADFDALQELNEDIKAWISIPDTEINYPVVQGQDNHTYLWTGYDGKRARAGSAFLDCKIHMDEQPDAYLIYGHSMASGSNLVFSPLLSYMDKAFWEQHPDIYMGFPDGAAIEGAESNVDTGNEYTFSIFAVCLVDAFDEKEIAEHYSISFESEDELAAYARELNRQSLYEIPMDMVPTRLVALSCCAYPGRNSDIRLLIYGGLFPSADA